MQKNSQKKTQLQQLIIVVAMLVSIAVISNFIFTRFDLTSDKRYTLSEHTRGLVKNLDDIVYFKIYLDGDLPPGFTKLKNSVRELLTDLKAYGGENIQYEFIDPAESSDKQTRNKVFKQLYDKGLDPTNLQVNESDGATSQKIIFPGIIVTYRGKELPVNILKNYVGHSPEANINSSVQALEYEITFAINRLITNKVPKIGFVTNHGELPAIEVDDIAMSLSSFYHLERVALNENLYSVKDTLNQYRYDLLVIARPTKTFTEKDKFIIDQFLMHGGKILWLIDVVQVDIDSLSYSRSTMGLANNLNLDDMLFKYGARLNPNLIQDMQCAVIPVNTALIGQQPRWSPAPWIYFPLLQPPYNSPITKNLDMVKAQFVGSIDTVGLNPQIDKKILLTSSKYSRTVMAPVLVDLSTISEKIEPARFNQKNLPVAVLLEGKFESVFANRITPQLQTDFSLEFKQFSLPTKMIVISDGDIIRNHVSGSGQNAEPLPLGYDRFTKQTFGNKEFIVNCVNYLCGNNGMMESRAKEHKLRLLDKPRMTKQKTMWQVINVVLPSVLVVLLGFVIRFYRKRKYGK